LLARSALTDAPAVRLVAASPGEEMVLYIVPPQPNVRD